MAMPLCDSDNYRQLTVHQLPSPTHLLLELPDLRLDLRPAVAHRIVPVDSRPMTRPSRKKLLSIYYPKLKNPQRRLKLSQPLPEGDLLVKHQSNSPYIANKTSEFSQPPAEPIHSQAF